MIASMATRRKILEPAHLRGPLKLTEWMRKKDINDAELARLMGVNRSTVGKWQQNQTRLDPFLQAKIAGILGILPVQLWFLPDSPEDRMITAMFRDILPNYPAEIRSELPKPTPKSLHK